LGNEYSDKSVIRVFFKLTHNFIVTQQCGISQEKKKETELPCAVAARNATRKETKFTGLTMQLSRQNKINKIN